MKRILLVEDNADERLLMRQVLSRGNGGYEIDEAATGTEALEKLWSPRGYDIVLLDYMLPGCSGAQVIERMRKADLRTPVVVVTCVDRAQVAVDSLRLGISDFVIKGSDSFANLPRTVERVLGEWEAESKARHAKEEREFQAEKLAKLGKILSEVLHDLRNPLSIISTSLEAVRDAKDKEKAVRLTLDLMLRNVDRSKRLINDLLDYSRPKELRPRSADLAGVASELVDSLRLTCEKQGIALRFDPPACLPEVEIDVEQIKRALLNLLMNAVQAMPKGGSLTVTASENRELRRVSLEIADTGTGIKLEDQKHLFERYFTTKQSGTGLGLVMVHQVLRQHHGSIQVQSREGAGTTFTVTLPMKQRP